MKKTLLLLCISLVVFSCKKEATQEDVVAYGETITEDELKDHLYIYASDEFEGRDTGAPGQKKAVEYLKNHYVSLNIPSPISKNDYFLLHAMPSKSGSLSTFASMARIKS